MRSKIDQRQEALDVLASEITNLKNEVKSKSIGYDARLRIKQAEDFLRLCQNMLAYARVRSEAAATEILQGMNRAWMELARSVQAAKAYATVAA